MDDLIGGKRPLLGYYEEGHKRETRKSYQKYIEEISVHGHDDASELQNEPEGDTEDCMDTESAQSVRKSRRTPVPKRSFDLIDDYSDNGELKKKDTKAERDNSPVGGSRANIIISKVTSTTPKGKQHSKHVHQHSKSAKNSSSSNDDTDVDNLPSRRSGRTPRPKKSFALIENEFEYGSGSKKSADKQPHEISSPLFMHPTPESLEAVSGQRNLKEKGNKRSRKSQPIKSVSQTEFFTQSQVGEDGGTLEIKQEIDCSASPEYPVQNWKGTNLSGIKVSLTKIKTEDVEEPLPVDPGPAVVPDLGDAPQEWGISDKQPYETGLAIKREDDCANCMYCQEQQFLHGSHSEVTHGDHCGMQYSWQDVGASELETFGNVAVPEVAALAGKDHMVETPTLEGEKKSKSRPGIMSSMKKKKKPVENQPQTGEGQFNTIALTQSPDTVTPDKIPRGGASPNKGGTPKSTKKRDRLTLTLKASDERLSSSDSFSQESPKEKKKATKKKKRDGEENLHSPTSGKSKQKRKEEHTSLSSVTERSDGHIILKLSSPTGDDGMSKSPKKEKSKSIKQSSKENNEQRSKEKKKKKKKMLKETNEEGNVDHIVLKLPVPNSNKDNKVKESKKALKRKKEQESTKSESDFVRVKKKKVFKRKNGQRMLVKIVTEHVNRDGKVLKQEEQKIKKDVLPPTPIPSPKKEVKEAKVAPEKRPEVKKTPQKEKREPGKTKSNKEKKTQTLTAYILFCRKHRPKLVEQNPEMDFSQISKKMAEKWKNTPEEEKQIYRQQLQEHKAKINAQKKTKLKYTGEKVTWEPSGKKEFPVVKYGTAYLQPVDMAAHLHLLGDALLMIATALRRQDQTTVHGALSVLLDSALCSIAPLVFLTSNVPEMDVIPAETKASVLDDIAYILPGM